MPRADLPNMSSTDTIAASAARTATGQGTATAGFGAARRLRVFVVVTAVSGTSPTLTVALQDSPDGTNWPALATTLTGSSPSITATGTYVFDVTGGFGDILRPIWTIGGTTPSFTFTVVVVSY